MPHRSRPDPTRDLSGPPRDLILIMDVDGGTAHRVAADELERSLGPERVLRCAYTELRLCAGGGFSGIPMGVDQLFNRQLAAGQYRAIDAIYGWRGLLPTLGRQGPVRRALVRAVVGGLRHRFGRRLDRVGALVSTFPVEQDRLLAAADLLGIPHFFQYVADRFVGHYLPASPWGSARTHLMIPHDLERFGLAGLDREEARRLRLGAAEARERPGQGPWGSWPPAALLRRAAMLQARANEVEVRARGLAGIHPVPLMVREAGRPARLSPSEVLGMLGEESPATFLPACLGDPADARPLAVMMTGSRGEATPALDRAVARALTDRGLPLRLLVVAGRNAPRRDRLLGLARQLAASAGAPSALGVVGMTGRIPEILTSLAPAALITKTGPTSITEGIVHRVPLIPLTLAGPPRPLMEAALAALDRLARALGRDRRASPAAWMAPSPALIPDWEAANATLVEAEGLGAPLRTPEALGPLIHSLAGDRATRARVARLAASRRGRATAADVVCAVAGLETARSARIQGGVWGEAS